MRTLIAALMLFVVAGCGQPESGTQKEKEAEPKKEKEIDVAGTEPAASVFIEQLYETYELDEAKANARWQGKVIEVAGKVREVEKTSTGVRVNFITLNSSTHIYSNVFCDCPPDQAKKLKSIDLENVIHIRCVCTGRQFSAKALGGWRVALRSGIVVDR